MSLSPGSSGRKCFPPLPELGNWGLGGGSWQKLLGGWTPHQPCKPTAFEGQGDAGFSARDSPRRRPPGQQLNAEALPAALAASEGLGVVPRWWRVIPSHLKHPTGPWCRHPQRRHTPGSAAAAPSPSIARDTEETITN